MQMIGFRNKVKNSVSSTERMASNRMSVGVMVRMLPNRKADKSGVNPGARKLKIGEIPAYNPRPIPPKEAWVIPPLMNTKRRVTMYVPIMPQAMLANKLPSKACWKKV